MEIQDFTGLILYYGRCRLYNIMQKTSWDGLLKYPAHSDFSFYNGIALVLGGNIQQGIRELKPLQNDKNLGLGAILSIIRAFKSCTGIEIGEIKTLEMHYEEKFKICNTNALYYASLYLFLVGDINQCFKLLNAILKINPQHENAIILKVWVELTKKDCITSNTLYAIESILQRSNNMDASLALVRYFQLHRQYENAVSILNKISIRLPESNVPLIEKMKTFLAEINWDQVYETSMRILNLEPSNISANLIKTYLVFAKNGNILTRISSLQELLRVIDKVEAGNTNLILEICETFSRICSRDTQILNIIFRYIESMAYNNSKNSKYLTELGVLKLMLGDRANAMNFFRSAINIDSSEVLAICGLTLCLTLDEDKKNQVQQNIELLEKFDGIDQVPIYLFIKSKLSNKSSTTLSLLNSSIEVHMKKLDNMVFSEEYVRILNPDFLMQIVHELLSHSPVQFQIQLECSNIISKNHIVIKLSLTILNAVIKVCPLHLQALYNLAKIHFLCGDFTLATKVLHQILCNVDATFTDAHFLLSYIQLQQNQFLKAMQSLESALTHNFAVRQNPTYHLLLGISQRKQQKISEAKKSFISALQLIGFYVNADTNSYELLREKAIGRLSTVDKVTLYLEYASCLRESGELSGICESESVLQGALEEFLGTPEEGRILIAKADLLILNYNINGAIQLLDKVQSHQSYYVQAKTHLANIFLKYNKDRIGFVECFQSIVNVCHDSESYLLLGDAYMSIQEPVQATTAFKYSVGIQPNDIDIASKLGRAYVKTHQYRQAVDYYNDALENPLHSDLKLDLAELYMKLKSYEKGIELLIDYSRIENLEEQDISSLRFQTRQLLLLSRMYEKFGDYSKSLETLKNARKIQLILKKRCELNYLGNTLEQNNILSKICLLIAEQSILQRDFEQALDAFTESLKISPNNISILSSLARIYLQINSVEQCQVTCSQILNIDKYNEAASVMMAEISFRKMELDSAAYHFSQLLLSNPCNFNALARLIEVLRRSGTLCEISLFMERAAESVENPTQSGGINYCKGLTEWYSGNPNTALRYFNAARRDSEWGQQSIFNMIEICINPNGEIPNLNETLESDLDNSELVESRIIALRSAERLLKELHPRENAFSNEIINHSILQYFLQLSSRQKFHIENALEKFTALSQHEGNDKIVGPILGMALSMVLLKQIQRAKNILKRVVNVHWNIEEAEYLERSWLLLATIYINSSKLDVAKDLVNKALLYNKSSFKAYELAGYISEKGQLFKEAIKYYKKAWEFCGKTKPHIGYKLAHILMKHKNYADAIDICHQMMRLHPDYINMRKDILEKCRNCLRQ